MKIQSTSEYHLFLSPRIQRNIDLPKVERLKALMRRDGFKQSFHLIVRREGRKLRIVHGQHRLLAAKELGISVYYVIDESMDDSDAVDIFRTNWTRADVVEAYAHSGNPHYAYLRNFAREHGITTGVATALLLGNANLANRGGWLNDFNKGDFEVTSEAHAIAVVSLAKEFAPYIKWWNESMLIRAIEAAMRVPGFNAAHLIKRIKSNQSLLIKQRSLSQYVRMLEEIYNTRAKSSEKLNIHFLWEKYISDQRARALEGTRKVRLDDEQSRSEAARPGFFQRLVA